MIVLTVSWSCNLIYIIGAVEYKLFVGSLNKQASVKEVEEVCIFLLSNFTLEAVILFSMVIFVWWFERELWYMGK